MKAAFVHQREQLVSMRSIEKINQDILKSSVLLVEFRAIFYDSPHSQHACGASDDWQKL